MSDKPRSNVSSWTDPTEIARLLDGLVDDVIHRDRTVNRINKSTGTLYRCDDPSVIAVAHSFEEMNRIIEEYRSRPENEFHKFSCGISSCGKTPKKFWINWYIRDERYIFNKTNTWRDDSELEGMPYIKLGRDIFLCDLGRDQNVLAKVSREQMKFNHCRAAIVVRQFVFFPEYKANRIASLNPFTKVAAIEERLQKKLKAHQNEIEKKTVYVITFPKDSHHKNHTTEVDKSTLCGEVTQKIQDLVLQDISTKSIKEEIDHYVTKSMFYKQKPPGKTDGRYFPDRAKILNLKYSVLKMYVVQESQIELLEKSFQTLRDDFGVEVTFKIDQPRDVKIDFEFIISRTSKTVIKTKKSIDNNVTVVKNVGQNTSSSESDSEDSNPQNVKPSQNRKCRTETHTMEPIPLRKSQDMKIQQVYLFYQTQNQQYLLSRYGSFVHLTKIKPKQIGCRTIAVSLFLICVRTNVDYQVVGTILCNRYNDHTKVLREALTEIKVINELWKPKYLIIDPSKSMISVVEDIFPDVDYYFNKDACIHEWEEYFADPLNGVKEHTEKLLNDLKLFQMSQSVEEISNLMKNVQRCPVWNKDVDVKFRNKWFSLSKRWTKHSLPQPISLLLKEEWLGEMLETYEDAVLLSTSRTSDGGIYKLIERLTSTPNTQYESYYTKNDKHHIDCQSSLKIVRKDSTNLAGIPLFMMSHMNGIINSVNKLKATVKKLSFGKYEVHTVDNPKQYQVLFGNQKTFPSCTCVEWNNNALPCQHIIHVFKECDLSFSNLSLLYRLNPCFKMDDSCINVVGSSIEKKDVVTQSDIDPLIKTRTVAVNTKMIYPLIATKKKSESQEKSSNNKMKKSSSKTSLGSTEPSLDDIIIGDLLNKMVDKVVSHESSCKKSSKQKKPSSNSIRGRPRKYGKSRTEIVIENLLDKMVDKVVAEESGSESKKPSKRKKPSSTSMSKKEKVKKPRNAKVKSTGDREETQSNEMVARIKREVRTGLKTMSIQDASPKTIVLVKLSTVEKVHPPTMQKVPLPIVQRVHPPTVQKVQPPTVQRVHSPTVHRVHPHTMQKVQPSTVQRVHPPTVQKVQPPTVQRVHPPTVQKIQPPTVQRIQPTTQSQGTTVQIHQGNNQPNGMEQLDGRIVSDQRSNLSKQQSFQQLPPARQSNQSNRIQHRDKPALNGPSNLKFSKKTSSSNAIRVNKGPYPNLKEMQQNAKRQSMKEQSLNASNIKSNLMNIQNLLFQLNPTGNIVLSSTEQNVSQNKQSIVTVASSDSVGLQADIETAVISQKKAQVNAFLNQTPNPNLNGRQQNERNHLAGYTNESMVQINTLNKERRPKRKDKRKQTQSNLKKRKSCEFKQPEKVKILPRKHLRPKISDISTEYQYPAFVGQKSANSNLNQLPTSKDGESIQTKIKIEPDDFPNIDIDIESVLNSGENVNMMYNKHDPVEESLEKISKLKKQLDASLRNEAFDAL